MADSKPRASRTPKNASGANRRRDWQPAFLAAFRETALVTEACKVAHVARTTVYEERQRNEEFAVAWSEIELETTEAMEREAYRRGVEGVTKPVFQGKEHVGDVQEFSDTLLIFMLKARKPETYRDNVHVQHSGTVRSETVEVPDDDARRREVAKILAEADAV